MHGPRTSLRLMAAKGDAVRAANGTAPGVRRVPGRKARGVRAPAVVALMGAILLAALALTGCGAGGHGTAESGSLPLDYLLKPPAGQEFEHVSSYDTTGGNADRVVIAPGDSAVLLDTTGPGIIRHIWITVSSRDPDYLRRIALKMFWDGETNPSVEAPLGDFFGNGFDTRPYAALPMGMSSGGFYCYLPMPFRRHARIVAYNGTHRPVDAFYFNIDLVKVNRLPRPLETFHAWWHRDRRTTSRAPYLILDAVGRGRYVGTLLEAESYTGSLSFLEGDMIYHVDGAFRGEGTGTEDYFNSGWYFDRGPFAAPLHGLIVKNDSLGRIVAYRWHLLDPIPFRDSIRIAIEHGTNNEVVADYASMAYWYQTEPHRPLPPLPPPDERRVLRVKIPPDAVLGGSLSAERRGADAVFRVPVPRPDRYELVVYPLGGPGRDSVTYRAGGIERRVSLAAPDHGTVLPPVALGVMAARGSVDVVVHGERGGLSPDSVRPAAVELRPVRVWAREWNVVGPFANPQRLGSEYSVALDSTYGPQRDPSLAAHYTGMGGRVVHWTRAVADAAGRIDLLPFFGPKDWVAAYAEAFLWSPDARRVTLLLGADDAHQLWVDGRLVSARQGRHVSEPDDIAVPARLHAGWNRVLLKVANLDGGWAFLLRAADPDGRLRWAARPGR